MEPSFEEPWSDGSDGSALAPAPEQPVEPEPGSMYVPPAPLGLIDPVGHPPINPNSPELTPYVSPGVIPNGGFHSEGGFQGPAGFPGNAGGFRR